ncbi:MAG: hypothetical protein CSA45_00620 [Gammaproteobacteria bacterium]|nr:MAG: hypothetical protein CSA45_00620 [Gammaproteobacteria bacterium]
MKPVIKEKFDSYPQEARNYLMDIRGLIFAVGEKEKVGTITETLKWGQPSYACHQGSPVRIDWSPKAPDSVSLYFHCQTTLVDTFIELYKDSLTCVGNREIVIPLSAPIPVEELGVCISLALRYHRIKKLPLLSM